MIFIKKILADLMEFVEFFKMKYKYDQRGVLKKYRLKYGLNKKLSEDMWCELFTEKSAYNYCAKFLLIKFWEDNNKISSKINIEGLKKWNELVTNINSSYSKLYDISENDILESEEMKEAFRKNDYDIYTIDDELAVFIIDRLKKYDFKGYNYSILYEIFNKLYKKEKRSGINLQYFYKPANAIEYILSLNKSEEKLG
ncbi:hypothetical protein [Dethiothermospora halolimnae]|uniref:hypothetical protein n=1 Tax=Dethiothermospora halolimnae TaxID=3114390 RepID=UPI003CCBB9E6